MTDALLFPVKSKGRDFYLYDLWINGKKVVSRSRTPEFDACRLLAARGTRGCLRILDGITGRLRCTVTDVERGAKLTVLESAQDGPRFVPWRPYPGREAYDQPVQTRKAPSGVSD